VFPLLLLLNDEKELAEPEFFKPEDIDDEAGIFGFNMLEEKSGMGGLEIGLEAAALIVPGRAGGGGAAREAVEGGGG
jgi:hypothetical protein